MGRRRWIERNDKVLKECREVRGIKGVQKSRGVGKGRNVNIIDILVFSRDIVMILTIIVFFLFKLGRRLKRKIDAGGQERGHEKR